MYDSETYTDATSAEETCDTVDYDDIDDSEGDDEDDYWRLGTVSQRLMKGISLRLSISMCSLFLQEITSAPRLCL